MKYNPLADMYAACRNISTVGSFKKHRDWLHKPSITVEMQESTRHAKEDSCAHEHTETQNRALSSASLLNLLAMSRSIGATDERDKI